MKKIKLKNLFRNGLKSFILLGVVLGMYFGMNGVNAQSLKCPRGYHYNHNNCVANNLGISTENGYINYENGYIEISNGEKTVYIKDRNQGATKVSNMSHDFEDEDYVASLGIYYYWGNNKGATREDLGIDWHKCGIYGETYCLDTNIKSMISSGFDEGKIGEDDTGWEKGNTSNPCDESKGEYLPSLSDWEDALEIWGDVYGEVGNDDVYANGEYFSDDILAPNVGNLFAFNDGYDGIVGFIDFFSDSKFPNLWASMDEGNLGFLRYEIFSFDSNYANTYSWSNGIYNNVAMPVRCFINPEYIESGESHTVLFMDGDEEFTTLRVKDGDIINLSHTPTKNGFGFIGWYTDKNLTQKFNIQTPITSDITLYARWAEAGITYEDGYVKVTDGVNTMYIRDRNVGAASINAFGNFYYRGNNSGVNYNDLEFNDVNDPNKITNMDDFEGFNEGTKLGEDNTGWEDGGTNNPCNVDEGEYLPSPEDWKKLMKIYGNIKGYGFPYNNWIYVEYSVSDYYLRLHYSSLDGEFQNDMLIPLVGNIEGNSYNERGNYFAWASLNDYGEVGTYSTIYYDDYNGFSYYIHLNPYKVVNPNWGNPYYDYDDLNYFPFINSAAPVRCFLDADYVEGVEKYIVTFDSKGGNESIPTQTLKEGKKLKEPAIPTKDGYTFAGWYTSDGKKWNFDEDTVQGEMTLYAKWRLCGVGFIVEDNQCIPEGIEFNGVIKVTDGERTMYVRDRNVGVTSDAAVAFLKLDFIWDKYDDLWDYQCNNQCYSQCNSYGDCYEMCYDECYDKNFLEVVEKEIGVSYESVDDAYNLLQLEVLKGLLPEKELEAYVLISNFDTISNQCAGNIFVDPFRNVDECVHNEMIRYINETFQLDHELQNMDDVENWVSEYFGMEDFEQFTSKYDNGYYRDLIDAQAFGNYYYRGNNSGVNYNDLEFEKPLDGNFSIINIDELVAKGFDGGNIGGDGLGWISGNVNPCDPEKGEYLPTPEDWKDLMGIWGNANGYSLGDESTILRNLDGYKEYNYFFGESQHREFQSELLIPYGGNIFKDTNFVSVFDNAWFPLRTSQDDEGNMGVYNRNGRWGGLYYTHYKKFIDDGWNELYAMPVRCFVNLAEISDVYVVSYETNGGNIIGDVNVIGGDTVILPTPTKDNYTFDGWYTDRALTNSFASTTPVTSDLTLYAKWSVKQSTSSNGGGGSSIRKDNCPNGDYTDSYYDGKCGKKPNTSTGTNVNNKTGHNSADEVEYDSSNYNPKYSDEINQAYQYAYHYGITTKNNIKDASMNGKLTRVAMAKMLSQYAINVLGMKPDTSRQNKFADVTDNLDTKYNNGVTLAYQLGIMGINMQNNEFKPYNYVTRGEFVTALSRLLYKTSDGEYRSTAKYYTNHVKKLENEGIITKVDPNMKELRGYVMVMLMRSAK